jgi:hypothetical protein
MQQQLEIEFFYPLIEQIPLELDFTSTEEWIAEWRKRQWNHNTVAFNGEYLTSSAGSIAWALPPTPSFVVKQDANNIGKWEITKDMFVYRPTKPNAVIRFMAKHLLGFKWHDGN